MLKKSKKTIFQDNNQNSDALGLPLFYQEYPEYFDTPSDLYYTSKKNIAIEKLLKKHKVKTVLDMTCGTGAQVFHLAKQGYNIIGSDFSPGLIKIAREKANKENLDIQFINGDMRTLQLHNFDAVITIDNAIGHLTKNDFITAIKNIYKNLTTTGIYIFDILNLAAMTHEVIESDNKRMTDSRVTHDGTVICNTRQSVLNKKNGRLISKNNFVITTKEKTFNIKNECALQIYTMKELRDMLSHNGFEVVEQHKVDAYTFEKSKSGYSIVTVAKKCDKAL